MAGPLPNGAGAAQDPELFSREEPNAMIPGTNRGFVFTLPNPTVSEKAQLVSVAWLNTRGVKYIVFQGEIAPTTGTPHLQGYIEFSNPVRWRHAHTTIGARGYIYRRLGSPDQARAYCSKPESFAPGVAARFEWGSFASVQQGRRSDIHEAVALIDSGASINAVALSNPAAFVKFHRGFSAYARARHVQRDMHRDVVVYAFVGATGLGKSRAAAQIAGPECFVVSPGPWWPDYNGHERVVVEEYVPGAWPNDFLLRILDENRVSVNIKGSDCQFLANFIIITSNFHPREWLVNGTAGSVAALLRRIRVCEFSAPTAAGGPVIHTWEHHDTIDTIDIPPYRPGVDRAKRATRDRAGRIIPPLVPLVVDVDAGDGGVAGRPAPVAVPAPSAALPPRYPTPTPQRRRVEHEDDGAGVRRFLPEASGRGRLRPAGMMDVIDVDEDEFGDAYADYFDARDDGDERDYRRFVEMERAFGNGGF